jgi:hypothetical protein
VASEVDICNLALAHLGDEANVATINPSDGSAQADHCARFYPIARDQVTAMHAWSDATKRIALALIDTDELPDSWAYCYAAPSGCINLLAVYAPGDSGFVDPLTNTVTPPGDSGTQPFIQEVLQDGTKVVFTNVEDAIARYIVQVTDTTKFSPLRVTAIARLLAAYLAGPVVKGAAGMKVHEAQMNAFAKMDFPLAANADARAQKVNLYNNFVPDGLAVRQ